MKTATKTKNKARVHSADTEVNSKCAIKMAKQFEEALTSKGSKKKGG